MNSDGSRDSWRVLNASTENGKGLLASADQFKGKNKKSQQWLSKLQPMVSCASSVFLLIIVNQINIVDCWEGSGLLL